MASAPEQNSCGVCTEATETFNFGARSCNACAAFFRRLVAKKQVPQLKCDGSCDMTNHILRRVCTRCRYEKCLRIGMKPSLVRFKNLENDKKRPTIPNLPLLGELKEAYEELNNSRRNFFQNDKVPILTNFEEMDEVAGIDLGFILETIAGNFSKMTPVADDQLRCLTTNFAVAFITVDMCFRSKNSDYYLLVNGNYVNVQDLDRHFQSNTQTENKANDAKTLLAPYWRMGMNSITRKFKESQLDLNEYLFFCGLIYWDFGLPDQSDECIEACLQMRSKLIEELIKYENSIRPSNDSSMRVGEIILMLQLVQKIKILFAEYKTVSIVYDLCAKHCPLFTMVE